LKLPRPLFQGVDPDNSLVPGPPDNAFLLVFGAMSFSLLLSGCCRALRFVSQMRIPSFFDGDLPLSWHAFYFPLFSWCHVGNVFLFSFDPACDSPFPSRSRVVVFRVDLLFSVPQYFSRRPPSFSYFLLRTLLVSILRRSEPQVEHGLYLFWPVLNCPSPFSSSSGNIDQWNFV